MRRLWLLPLVAALTACPHIDTGADGGGPINVDSSGGIFVRDGAVIQIPSGAVSSPQTIFVTTTDTGIPDVPGRTRISLGYRFTPSSITFQDAVTITLPYLPARLPNTGIDPNSYDMRLNTAASPYEQLIGATTDTTHQVVSANADGLGLFWITCPSNPAVSSLTLQPTSAFLQVGQTQQFTATVTGPTGNPLPNVTVDWSIVPPRAASVDGGLVKALAPGNATLTATVGQQTATAPVLIQGNTPGPLSFIHDNPFPTGNDLFGGTTSGSGALMAGGNGTVLSVDGTGTWARLYSQPLVTLHSAAGTSANGVAVGTGVDSSGNPAGVVVQWGAATPSVSVFPTSQPQALWFDGTHGMAAGTGNDVLVLEDGGWTTAYSPSIETLLSVVGDGDGGFVTVGDRGSIYRFDPATLTWNSLYQNQLSVRLDGAFLVDATGGEAWGVGGNKLWHFLGSAWQALNLPGAPSLTETTAIGPIAGQIAVAGDQLLPNFLTQGYLLLYSPSTGVSDGGLDAGPPSTWSSQTVRGPQIIRGIIGGGSTGYAVGDLGAVWQYSDGGFAELSHGFYGTIADIAVVGSTPIAAVNDCVGGDAGCTLLIGSVMIRTAPATWVPLGAPQPFLGPVTTVAAASTGDVYVTADGLLYHFDGDAGAGAWTPQVIPGGTTGPIQDMELCGTELTAVGAQGTVYTGDGVLSAQGTVGGNDLYALNCPSPTDLWVAGDFSLFENGVLISSQTVNPAPWRAVWSPGPAEAYAFGLSPYGVYWDSANMNVVNAPGGLPPNAFTQMWGSSIDNLYLVGSAVLPVQTGYGVRFDGAQWTLIDIGAHHNATAVAGSSNLEVWAGTEGGGLLHGLPP
jgi:hypothetical protein